MGKHSTFQINRFWEFNILLTSHMVIISTEKETQKGHMKNTKLKKSKRCENVTSERCENVKSVIY